MTKKFKHKKLKNTGLLYELLIRQMTSDVLQGKKPVSFNIIKKYFKQSSPLTEELKLYNTLINSKEKDSTFALSIVDSVIKTKDKLNIQELKRQKYNLIKEILDNFDKESFLKTQIDNYKLYASIFNILEYRDSENPNLFQRNKLYIANHIKSDRVEAQQEKSELMEGIDPELKSLTFKLLTEKFNNKFSSLSQNQKKILRHFIFNSVDSQDTKKFIQEQIEFLDKKLAANIKTTKNEVLKIKLKEVKNLLPQIKNSSFITESHYLSLIRYNELIKELNEK